MSSRTRDVTLTDGAMRVLRAIAFAAVPILLLALLVAALSLLVTHQGERRFTPGAASSAA